SMVLSSEVTAQSSLPDTLPIAGIREEMLAAFPTFAGISHAEQLHRRGDTTDTIQVFLVHQASTFSSRQRHAELLRMHSFLNVRVEADSIQVVSVVDVADSTSTIRR